MDTNFDLKDTLNKVFDGEFLEKQEARDVLYAIGNGMVDPMQIASFLTCFQMRPVSGYELSGFRQAMIDHALQMDFSDYETIDLCGTGGDGKDTFNISTVASFIVAGAGYKVSKHGNYGVSSGCGSSNVLEYLGYQFSNNEDKLKSDLERGNFCYLHAPLFHPAMKHVGPIRKSLKVKTFFNILGPLLNPSRPQCQVTGVYNSSLIALYHDVFEDMGSRFAVIHSDDGYDEISLTSSFVLCTKRGEDHISPESLGFNRVSQMDLHGGKSISDAARLFIDILEGKGTEAQNNVTLVNAAYAIQLFDEGKSIEDCYDEAKNSLKSGKALDCLRAVTS